MTGVNVSPDAGNAHNNRPVRSAPLRDEGSGQDVEPDNKDICQTRALNISMPEVLWQRTASIRTTKQRGV